MTNLFVAEWKKIMLNYKLTGFLVWIFPVGLGAFYAMLLIGGLIDRRAAQGMLSTGSNNWIADASGIWMMINTFPLNILGRLLPLAFMATVFASEYSSGMWKNLIPRARRPSLLLSKFTVLIVVLMLSFLACSVVVPVGQALGHWMLDIPYGPKINGEVLAEFAEKYSQSMGMGLASLLLLSTEAALAAIITRSVLGGLLFGFGFSVLDPLSLVGLNLLGKIFENPELVNLYRLTPSYHLTNALLWLQLKMAYIPAMGFTDPPGLGASLAALTAWIVVLVALAVIVFDRQDIGA